MARLLTKMFVLEKYGPRLNVEAMAEVMGLSQPTIYNRMSAGTMPFPIVREGSRSFADYEAVADYLDKTAEEAREMAA